MKTNSNISNFTATINSRNGNGIFCSNFTGRNIGKSSGNCLYDIIDW